MLHNPRWNYGTLDGLITWLEGKNPDETYDFSCTCLIWKYASEYTPTREVDVWKMPPVMQEIYAGADRHCIGRARPHTFGAALKRAYAARPSAAA
jgi:hypothetical protein